MEWKTEFPQAKKNSASRQPSDPNCSSGASLSLLPWWAVLQIKFASLHSHVSHPLEINIFPVFPFQVLHIFFLLLIDWISFVSSSTKDRKISFYFSMTAAAAAAAAASKSLSRLVITFLPGSKRLLISWFNFMAAITVCSDLGAPQSKVCYCFHCFPIYFPWSDGTGCHDLRFWMPNSKPTFSLPSITFIKRLVSSSSLSGIRVVSSAYMLLLLLLSHFSRVQLCATP